MRDAMGLRVGREEAFVKTHAALDYLHIYLSTYLSSLSQIYVYVYIQI